MTWPFDDPPNVAVFTTKSIAFRQRPVLLVTHDEEDGAWQFLPREGAGHETDAALVTLRSMIERSGTLAELADLPRGVARMERISGFALATEAVDGRKLAQMTAVTALARHFRTDQKM